MNLQRKIQIGGWAILGGLIAALLIAAIGIQQIRFGGPHHRAEQQMNALEADLLPPPLFVVEGYLNATLSIDEWERRDEFLKRLDDQRKSYLERKAFWSKAPVSDGIRAEINVATATADEFWTCVDTEFEPALRSGDRARINLAHGHLEKIFDKHQRAVTSLLDNVERDKAETAASATRVLVFTLVLLSAMAAGIVALILYSRRHLSRDVINPLAYAAGAMTRMAAGDLSAGTDADVGRPDEIGDLNRALVVFRQAALDRRSAEEAQKAVVDALSGALDRLAEGDLNHVIETPFTPDYEPLRLGYNGTIAQLGGLIERVAGSASSVATGSSEIRAASDDLALRNEQQAASLEETAAAMNQVTTIVRDTATGAGKVQAAIAEAHREATEGGETVRRAIGAMTEIEQGAREIAQIINVIDGIAFQTNLLALNAGVEAARAGDAGKGFAVVANEVRALAQRSADAARDIKALITGSTEQVEGGVRLVNETGELLGKIVGSIGEINASVTAIAQATEAQSVNLQQVNAAIGEMDRMTQQNAAMVEQSTAAARSLAEEAQDLAKQVGQFRTGQAEGGQPASVFAFNKSKRPGAQTLQARGNLALRAEPALAEDDWSEF